SERSRMSGPPNWPLPPPPPPPGCPPKKRLKKSWKGLSSSPPPPAPGPWSSGLPGIIRRCGFLMVDSVLMLTTDGSSSRAIDENWLDIWTGEGTFNGVASAEEFCWLPLTAPDTTVPIRMPNERVARMTKVEAKRLALNLCLKPETCESIHCPPAQRATRKLYSRTDIHCDVWGITRVFSRD